MTGYIKIFRSIFKNPVLKGEVFTRREAWLWLIAEAAWFDRRAMIGGNVVVLKRGQVAHSIRYMADAWGWSRSKVTRFLTILKDDAMIVTETGTGETIITLCNYGTFQSDDNDIEPLTGTTPGQERDKDKETKKVINIIKGPLPDDFPGSDMRALAIENWEKMGMDISVEIVASRFRNYYGSRARSSPDWAGDWLRWCYKERGPRIQRVSSAPPDPWENRLRGFRKDKFWVRSEWGAGPDDGDFKRKQPEFVVALWNKIKKEIVQ